MDAQHEFFANIISTQHVHLDHDSCLEIIAVRGKSRDIGLLASRLKAMIGVAHLEVSVSSYGLVGDEAETGGHAHDGEHPHDHRHT